MANCTPPPLSLQNPPLNRPAPRQKPMTKDYQQLWKGSAGATDKAHAVRFLAEILADKEGRAFISHLDDGDAGLCVEILGSVSCSLHLPNSPPQTFRQGIAAYNLESAEKQAFFVTLRKLTGRHGLLPARMRIKERVDVSDEILAFSVLAELRSGTYEGRPVAVKAMRVTAQDDFVKIRKVSINVGHPGYGLNNATPAILQGSRPLEHTIPSKHPEAHWGSGGCGETAARSRIRVDVTREHYGVH